MNQIIPSFHHSTYLKSLSTNVPLEEVIEICVDMLYEMEKPTIIKNNFKEQLKVLTSGVQFSFNSQIHS